MDEVTTVLRLAGGRFAPEIYEALRRVAEEVIATGNGGSVGVTLAVSRPTNDPSIIIKTAVKTNLPKSPELSSMLFLNEEGFHANDPRQAMLPGTVRETEATNYVDRETGEVTEGEYREVGKDGTD